MVACAVWARSGGRGASVPGIGSKFRFKASLAAGVALFLGWGAAFAQVPPAQPVAPTREQIQPPPAETVPHPARLTVEGEIEHAPCALDRPDYQNIRFTLRDVVFDNLRGLPAARLRAAYADHVGQENNVAVLCEIRDRAAAILRELAEMGISVAVDDFGTGYSNLSYLVDFSFSKLKIDGSFISRIDTDSNSGAVVSTIVGLSRALGVGIIAEGVETESQATLLRAAGCETVQGYLFGRPAPLKIGLQPRPVHVKREARIVSMH